MLRFLWLPCLFLLAACGSATGGATPIPAPTYDTDLPFPIPASCPQAAYIEQSTLSPELLAATPYWMGNATLVAGRVDSPLWRSGENAVVWGRSAGVPNVTLRLLEGKSTPATVLFAPVGSPVFRSTITFPRNGCWEITASTTTAYLRFIIYAYPAKFLP